MAGATAAREAPGPIHAGNTFGWYGHGGLVYDETFVGPLNHRRWRVEGPGAVRTQHGMLTLNTATKGSVSAQMTIPGRAYGRWETRLRQRQYGHKHTPYRVLTELVPVTKVGEGCGEQNIALNKFTMGDNQVNFYIRSRPDNLYQASMKRGFGQDQWHTFAVEVTPKRISWFVDSHVIRCETPSRRAVRPQVPGPVHHGGREGQADEQGPDADGLAALLDAAGQERALDQGAGRPS